MNHDLDVLARAVLAADLAIRRAANRLLAFAGIAGS